MLPLQGGLAVAEDDQKRNEKLAHWRLTGLLRKHRGAFDI